MAMIPLLRAEMETNESIQHDLSEAERLLLKLAEVDNLQRKLEVNVVQLAPHALTELRAISTPISCDLLLETLSARAVLLLR
eukprot:scaffold93601_cov32-Tisochrysis_lutea.AAC.2